MRGAARSGRGSHLSHGRPGHEVEDGRLADDDTNKREGRRIWSGVADEEVLNDNTDKRGEEGMAGVWRVWHSAPLSALAGDEMGANLDLGGLGDSKCHSGDGAKCGGFCAN